MARCIPASAPLCLRVFFKYLVHSARPVDHIVTEGLIRFARFTEYDFVKLRREVAILDEEGRFIQTEASVKEYGFQPERFAKGGFHIAPHTNSFIVTRKVYLDLGGVSERRVKLGRHPNREEIPFRRRIWSEAKAGKIRVLDEHTNGADHRPMLYMVPNGAYCGHKDYNPFGLFHNLPRKTGHAA